jgi:hypothetical protein
MKWVKVTLLCSLFLVTSSCTVLGFATDMVLLSAVNGGDNVDASQEELFFTNEGLKHDATLSKKWLAELSNSKEDLNPLSEQKIQPITLICKKVVDGKQQCYAPEYYKDMYIQVSTSK